MVERRHDVGVLVVLLTHVNDVQLRKTQEPSNSQPPFFLKLLYLVGQPFTYLLRAVFWT